MFASAANGPRNRWFERSAPLGAAGGAGGGGGGGVKRSAQLTHGAVPAASGADGPPAAASWDVAAARLAAADDAKPPTKKRRTLSSRLASRPPQPDARAGATTSTALVLPRPPTEPSTFVSDGSAASVGAAAAGDAPRASGGSERSGKNAAADENANFGAIMLRVNKAIADKSVAKPPPPPQPPSEPRRAPSNSSLTLTDGGIGPPGTYYHARTCIAKDDPDGVEDSDDEEDLDEWTREDLRQLSDFEDIDHREKLFMHDWNVFVHRFKPYADRDVPAALAAFAKYRGDALRADPALRRMFVLHLVNQWDFGVVEPDVIDATLKIVDAQISEGKEKTLDDADGSPGARGDARAPGGRRRELI